MSVLLLELSRWEARMRRERWPVVPWLYRRGLQSVSPGEKGKGKYYEFIFQPTNC